MLFKPRQTACTLTWKHHNGQAAFLVVQAFAEFYSAVVTREYGFSESGQRVWPPASLLKTCSLGGDQFKVKSYVVRLGDDFENSQALVRHVRVQKIEEQIF